MITIPRARTSSLLRRRPPALHQSKVEPEVKTTAFDLCVEQVVEELSVQELYLGYTLAELTAIAVEQCRPLLE